MESVLHYDVYQKVHDFFLANVLNVNRVLRFSLQLFSAPFLILRRIQRDISTKFSKMLAQIFVSFDLLYNFCLKHFSF